MRARGRLAPAAGALIFPRYTRAERVADAIIHGLGVPLGVLGALVLLRRAAAGGPVSLTVVAVYLFGLVGMLGASACYQLAPAGLVKERLRRIDQSMIFVMIAGTYTPISATVLYASGGAWLCLLLWALAGGGVFLSLRHPRRFERTLLALYLAMGWMMLLLVHACYVALPPAIFWLIVAGGALYTVGAVVQAVERIRFGNPIWHGLVLAAASLHYAAISLQLTGGLG